MMSDGFVLTGQVRLFLSSSVLSDGKTFVFSFLVDLL